MKTLFIYNDMNGEGIQYFILKGDYRHLHDVYINWSEGNLEKELNDLIFKPPEDGEIEHKIVMSDDISLIQNKAWDFAIACGCVN